MEAQILPAGSSLYYYLVHYVLVCTTQKEDYLSNIVNVYYVISLSNGLVGTAIPRIDGHLTWSNPFYGPQHYRYLGKLAQALSNKKMLVDARILTTKEMSALPLPRFLKGGVPVRITMIHTTARL